MRVRPEVLPPNPLIRRYVLSQAYASHGPAWSHISDFPSIDELEDLYEASLDQLNTPRNIIKGPWPSVDDFLSTHYHLLRADALFPLAIALHDFRQTPAMLETNPVSSIGIYEQVNVVGVTLAKQGIGVRVQFSLRRVGKNIAWRQSKRLQTGSLVVLVSANNPNKCVIATVAGRPLDLLLRNPPQIDLFFPNEDDIEIDPSQEWIIIEARQSFYEAYRHTLKALQHMSGESFPLQEHLVQLQKAVIVTQRLQNDPHMELSSAFQNSDTDVISAAPEPTNVLTAWPTGAQGLLDASQNKALQRAVTKCLALVQGPPGCGKTFTSIQAIKILLANKQPEDPPIIITAQTNHALDQLLRLVAVFEDNFVRLGSRSKDTGVVKEHVLYELREAAMDKQKPLPTSSGHQVAHARLKNAAKALKEALLSFEVNDYSPDPALFLQYRILKPEQVESLQKSIPKEDNSRRSPLLAWVGKQFDEYRLQTLPQDFGFTVADEPGDYEMEEIDEQEAEQQQKLETLEGDHIRIHHVWEGSTIPGLKDVHIEKILQRTNDMAKIPPKVREAVFRYLIQKLRKATNHEFQEESRRYMREVRELSIAGMERDEVQIKNANIIGLTTSRFSRDRALFSALRPRIVLVEEAGESLEGPVIALCVESLEQLVLVGDHQQLRPHCQVTELAGDPVNLAISPFERLVLNGVEFSFLELQRRMRPEISRMLTPIYEDRLKNHPLVSNPIHRPEIAGMGSVRTWWWNHSHLEGLDSNNSIYNEHEVQMIIGFIKYLLKNGHPPRDITVLTFYNGQRKRLLGAIRQDQDLFPHRLALLVRTVDSYQGEECPIILLSTVRSNTRSNLGFVEESNRMCVSLSRAQRGLYIFGNSKILDGVENPWQSVIALYKGGQTPGATSWRTDPEHGPWLPLTCTKHHQKINIVDPSEWKDNNGGCNEPCSDQLPCGHPCPLTCHPFDHQPEHVTCHMHCSRILDCGHTCGRKCFEDCLCLKCGQASASHLQTSEKIALKKSLPMVSTIPVRSKPHARNITPNREPSLPVIPAQGSTVSQWQTFMLSDANKLQIPSATTPAPLKQPIHVQTSDGSTSDGRKKASWHISYHDVPPQPVAASASA